MTGVVRVREPIANKFLKVRRTAVDIAIVGVAVALQRDKEGRVADGTSTPLAAVAQTLVDVE